MYRLSIPDMSCGHCVSAITNAVKALDSSANLQFALSEHKVDVTTSAGIDALTPALAEAGYPVHAVIEIGPAQYPAP